MIPLPLFPREILNYRLKCYVDFWGLILQFAFHWESTLLFNDFLEGEKLKPTRLQKMQTALEEIYTIGFPSLNCRIPLNHLLSTIPHELCISLSQVLSRKSTSLFFRDFISLC